MKTMIRLGDYFLYSPPYKGGFCRVYKAVRVDNSGKFFAIKMPININSAEQKKALERKVKVLSKVQHPNIIRLLEVHLDKKTPYIVLEYLPGGSLRESVGQLSYEEAIFILYRISSALAVFHWQGGFHRDIKPDNILISEDGDVVLADMNIANVPSTGSRLTHSIAGTRGYIDPWVVNHQYDSHADIFSLGITITELFTGIDPRSLINSTGLAVDMSAFPIENNDHKRAFYKLMKVMISNKRDLRPEAHTIHQYALSLLNGGPLPQLPIKTITRKAYEQPLPIGGILVAGALMVLWFVGIAALCGKK